MAFAERGFWNFRNYVDANLNAMSTRAVKYKMEERTSATLIAFVEDSSSLLNQTRQCNR